MLLATELPTTWPVVVVSAGRSSMIVPVAVATVASCAFDAGSDSVTVKVSSCSSVASFSVPTVNVPVVWPLAIYARPVVGDPRSASVAVSPLSTDAVQVTRTSPLGTSDSVSVTVKVSASPSAAVASATLRVGFGVDVTSCADSV